MMMRTNTGDEEELYDIVSELNIKVVDKRGWDEEKDIPDDGDTGKDVICPEKETKPKV